MSENKNNIHGHEIIKEVAELLREQILSPPKATMINGENVRIIIDPRWDEPSNTYQTVVLCYVPSQQQVDWEFMPISLISKDNADIPVFIIRLDQRGQGIIQNLPDGQYQISAPVTYFSTKNNTCFPAPVQEDLPDRLVASDRQDEATWPIQPATHVSNDVRVTATTQFNQSGNIILTFETDDEALADSVIQFSFVRSCGQVEFTDNVILSKVKDRALWLGRWQDPVSLKEPCSLVYEVVLIK